MKIRTLGVLTALLVSSAAMADQMYTGTWDISGDAAGTITLRIRDNGTVSGALVGNTGRRVTGHLRGTYEGKRFKIVVRIRGKRSMEFQGNFTRNDQEAHMDGLQYVRNKPVDDVRWTMNVTAMPQARR